MRSLLNEQKGIYWIVGKNGWKGTGLGSLLKAESQKLRKKLCPISFEQFFRLWLRAIIEKDILAKHIIQEFLGSFDIVIFENVDILLSGKSATIKELKSFLRGVVARRNTQILLLCDKKPLA